MEKLYWTIGEVAEMLGETVTLVRSWSNAFPRLVRPKRNAKGNRLYSADDVEALRQLHHLVRDKGMTLEGAGRMMLRERTAVRDEMKVLESLKAIREQLLELRNSLE